MVDERASKGELRRGVPGLGMAEESRCLDVRDDADRTLHLFGRLWGSLLCYRRCVGTDVLCSFALVLPSCSAWRKDA